MEEKSLFWADQKAEAIMSRKRFHYLDKPAPKPKKYIVKTSASLSGVLHIGRLSDTVRGESVFRALQDAGAKAELIWVAEDMDPLRKVPRGVPASYEKYIGMPVTDIPDPAGCHKSYAEHHVSEYFKVIDLFVSTKMEKYSMREEYRKGSFREQIKKILANIDLIKEIQKRYRTSPLPAEWSPWKPLCDNCGKIITTQVKELCDGVVRYECKDYQFEKTKAKGCGHKGENDPLKFNGKLMWKSEWATQWSRWQVATEGAGKEYQVPMSAWWVNAEIAERVLDFPMPEPIFYEHIMIDNEKMSASKGNVVYPKDWLEVATPELLRFFYNKKIMKTRSFSWKDLPVLYTDYNNHQDVYFGRTSLENKKEENHMKRLFEICQPGKPKVRVAVPFELAAMVAQTVQKEKALERLKEIMKAGDRLEGSLAKQDEEYMKLVLEKARIWAEKYAPEADRIVVQENIDRNAVSILSPAQRKALREFGEKLKAQRTEKQIFDACFEAAKSSGLKPQEFFQAAYLAILGRERGPRLASLILSAGREKIAQLLEKV